MLAKTIYSSVLTAALLACSGLAATVVFDCNKVNNICANDFYAINCAGKPTRLNRDSDDASAHRAANACHSGNRCSGGDDQHNSCDEYPYASAEQGGKGAVTRCVPSHENSVQGGTLSSFYTRNKIGNGDAYDVGFSNTSGVQYSDSCDNSGNEVIRRDGGALPHAGRSLGTAGEFTLHRPRRFVTSEDSTVLLFEPLSLPGLLDDKVGSEAYLAHEDRFVTLVRAM